jgi:hypothetical protein
MTGLAAAATMTTIVEYQYEDAARLAAAMTSERFVGDIVVRSQWEIDPVLRILQLQRLPENWNANGTPKITDKAVDTAITLVGHLAELEFDQLPAPFVGPVGAGGISFEWSFGSRDLEFFIFNDGSIEYLKSEANEPFDEGSLRLWALGRLRELVSWLVAAAV